MCVCAEIKSLIVVVLLLRFYFLENGFLFAIEQAFETEQ